MEWSELIAGIKVKVTVLNPVRHGEYYKTGQLVGFKAGLIGTRITDNHGSFVAPVFLRPPKVLVAYDIYTFGKKQHCDWIPVDNCDFELLHEPPKDK